MRVCRRFGYRYAELLGNKSSHIKFHVANRYFDAVQTELGSYLSKLLPFAMMRLPRLETFSFCFMQQKKKDLPDVDELANQNNHTGGSTGSKLIVRTIKD